MRKVTITAAPQAYLSEAIYEKWMIDHTGTKDEFFNFLTTPSAEREMFLASIDCEIDIAEGLGTATYNA